jgi:GDPmannose 4,6-dehydratase
MDVNATGVMRCLEAIVRHAPNCRFYNAGSSEQFGDVQYSPQDEKHPHRARSPYGASKIAAHQIVKTYRESFNLYAVQGLLFNHESPRRGEEFVTRKITLGVARIAKAIKNKQLFDPIELGNIDSKRDWSHAADFVDGIWRMLNQDTYYTPQSAQELREGKIKLKEYVLSSNETHAIKEFIELAFQEVNIEGVWTGEGENQKYNIVNHILEDNENIKSYNLVRINPKFYRPADVEILLGDSSLARKELGWSPKYDFKSLVREMVQSDLSK